MRSLENLKQYLKNSVTDSPTWIQEILAHLKMPPCLHCLHCLHCFHFLHNIHLKTASHLCSYFLLLFSPIVHHVIYPKLLGKENSQRAAFTFYTHRLKVSILLGFDHSLTLPLVGAIYLAEQRKHMFLAQFGAKP